MKDFNPEYHFIAIGGIGQSALAKILLEEGHKVSGSDIKESKYLEKLKHLGAKIYIGHSEDNLQGRPTVVVSSAIKEDNPEIIKARTLGLKIIHRSDLLKIISEKYSCFIGFAGTHGKTTTSGMCAYLLSKAGKKPAYAIGGIIPELDTNGGCENKNTPYFSAELDESDGTIVKYSPKILAINNLEADHPDFYKNGLPDILNTFSTLLKSLKQDARVIINVSNPANCELIKTNPEFKNFVTYSVDKNADYCAKNIKYDDFGSNFEVYKNDKILGKVELTVLGRHNVENALCVCAALVEAGIEFSEFSKYFPSFSGMGRRFQKVAEFNNIKVIDDYAHHPTEIKTTLEALKNYKTGRVVAIFQPHRYSRFQALFNEFQNAFEFADFVAVLDVYAAGESPINGVTSKSFAQKLQKAKYFKGTIDEAAKEIINYLETGDIVLTFGAGDITKLGSKLYEQYSLKA